DDEYLTVAVADRFLFDLRFGRDRAESTTRVYAGGLARFLGWCAGTRALPDPRRRSPDGGQMSAAVLLGGLFGIGLFGIAMALRPSRTSLETLLLRLDGPASGRSAMTAASRRAPTERMGAAVARTLEDLGADHVRLQADLRVTGRSLEALCMERLMVGVVGLAMALVPGGVLWAAGLGLPLGAWIGGAVLLGVGGFVLPVATLHSVAEERRRSFRYAFSAFLDLTAVSLSSGVEPPWKKWRLFRLERKEPCRQPRTTTPPSGVTQPRSVTEGCGWSTSCAARTRPTMG
ncbi:MAG: hypothetical protein ACRD1K_04550, partial [Acidimicrobiales bacterium]